jgi:hypothetical protein
VGRNAFEFANTADDPVDADAMFAFVLGFGAMRA